jgi:putative membrane protein
MITDHTKAGADFKAALENVGTTSSVSTTALQPKEQQALDRLKAASGEAFDKGYVAAQVRAHDEAVALFRSYSNSGDDPALKEFAKKTLPVLEMHQEHVKEL